jgi:hypothetical protein
VNSAQAALASARAAASSIEMRMPSASDALTAASTIGPSTPREVVRKASMTNLPRALSIACRALDDSVVPQVLPLGRATVPPWLPAKSARVSNLPQQRSNQGEPRKSGGRKRRKPLKRQQPERKGKYRNRQCRANRKQHHKLSKLSVRHDTHMTRRHDTRDFGRTRIL